MTPEKSLFLGLKISGAMLLCSPVSAMGNLIFLRVGNKGLRWNGSGGALQNPLKRMLRAEGAQNFGKN